LDKVIDLSRLESQIPSEFFLVGYVRTKAPGWFEHVACRSKRGTPSNTSGASNLSGFRCFVIGTCELTWVKFALVVR